MSDFADRISHRKLVFPRVESPVENDYANLYRFGEPSAPAPLLVFIGGQISIRKHRARFETEPTWIVQQLERAVGGVAPRRLDFLIAPSPPLPRPGYENHGEDFFDFFVEDLIPALDAPSPRAMGFVGYSYGASLASYVALGLEEARVVVTIGGVGARSAARLAAPIVPKDILFEMYRNAGDEAENPVLIARSMPRPIRARAMPPREGAHDFDDYAGNGTVADAFRTVLKAVMTEDVSR